MTREEAIKVLKEIEYPVNGDNKEYRDTAFEMAIKALEQEPCDDAISREDALMALTGEWTELTDELIHQFIRRIKNLPSVNPQYTGDEIQKMQDLEQAEIEKAYELGKAEGQKSEDVISRQSAIFLASDLKQDLPDDERIADMVMAHNEGILEYQTQLSLLPSVNPQEKTGHWIDDEFGSKCSCCGIHTHLDKFDRPMKFKYCSMCGAKMIESLEERDKE